MNIYKCPVCGENFDKSDIDSANGVIECQTCFFVSSLPKPNQLSEIVGGIDMAYNLLHTGKFEDSYKAFFEITKKDDREPEAYFGMFLARAKVYYFKDVENNECYLLPLYSNEDLYSDSNFDKAISLATSEQKDYYNEKKKQILSNLHKVNNYDSYILCKKEEDGEETEDYSVAIQISDALNNDEFSTIVTSVEDCDTNVKIDNFYQLLYSNTLIIVCGNKAYLRDNNIKGLIGTYNDLIKMNLKDSGSLAICYTNEPIDKIPGMYGSIQGIDYNDFEALDTITSFIKKEDNSSSIKSKQLQSLMDDIQASLKEDNSNDNIEEEEMVEIEVEDTDKDDEYLILKMLDIEIPKVKKMVPKSKLNLKFDKYDGLSIDEYNNALAIFSKYSKVENNVLVKFTNYDYDGIVVIPEGIKEIGMEAFINCQNITRVVLPNTIEQIDKFAFYLCISLEEINIPSSVKVIGYYAFGHCVNLTDVRTSDGLQKICADAFNTCRSLTKLDIPDTVEEIEKCFIMHCNSLTSIELPLGLTDIPEKLIFGVMNVKEVIIKQNVRYIYFDFFTEIYPPHTMKFPKSLKSIVERYYTVENGNLTITYY